MLLDPLLYFSRSIVRKPVDVQVLRSASKEKPFLGWQPEVHSYTTPFPIHLGVLYYLFRHTVNHAHEVVSRPARTAAYLTCFVQTGPV